MAARFRLFGRAPGTAPADTRERLASADTTDTITTTRAPDVAVSPQGHSPAHAPLTVRFWGVRGSYPATFGAGTTIGGATTCLEVSYLDQTIVIDAGSGAIALGEEVMRRWGSAPGQARDITVIFTHAHHDHLCGLPFFAPLFDPGARLRFYGPDLAGMAFPEIIAGYMRPPYFPLDFRTLPSSRSLTTITGGARIVAPCSAAPVVTTPGAAPHPPPDAVVIDTLFSALHPADGVMVYRITAGGASFVFATDVEVGAHGADEDRRLIAFAQGANLLIHDAQYGEGEYSGSEPKRGYGHSTPAMAASIARAAHAPRLALFHHDPHSTDEKALAMEREAQIAFPGAFVAREGQTLRLDGAAPGQV